MALVTRCSPQVHPAIVNAIVKTESSFNPFAIGVNKGVGWLSRQPTSYTEAVQTAKQLLARGANIDLGLGQINSANLNWLGLSVEQVFNPCANLQALQYVYLHCYDKAGSSGFGDRMQRAFSCYNTGNAKKGFSNGYVAKVTSNFNRLINTFSSQPIPPFDINHQTQSANTLKNTPTIAHNQRKSKNGTKVPPNPTNAPDGVSERFYDSTIIPPQTPDNFQADNVPVKVHNSWDIFRDF